MLGRVLSDAIKGLRRGKAQAAAANPLAEYYFNNPGRLIHKWHHYFDIYHRHFEAFRHRSPVVVEVGVFHGGSLEMWRKYFGPGARIIGIDVDPRCRQFEGDSINILIGDQADRNFLGQVRALVPHVDIVIDDGGHTMEQQITTFEELYPHVQPHGVYLCEDLHTSYMPPYGGGYRKDGTFIQYATRLVDQLHGWYSKEPERFRVDDFTRSAYALHFYDSVLVVEKKPIPEPVTSITGKPSFPL
ncbi:MAG TPA: class I SAM-dependent methyltransferase [Burkholderiales bacterium]|nr:class I SAM-dependent methyltransferase [Burkholderiales bacterium]